jgi:hypothetical protein
MTRLFRTLMILCCSLFLLFAQSVKAQDCSDVLVKDTIDKNVLSVQNISIASSVTNQEWNDASQTLGANGVLYGVPIGVSYYGDYQSNVQAIATAYTVSSRMRTKSAILDRSWFSAIAAT